MPRFQGNEEDAWEDHDGTVRAITARAGVQAENRTMHELSIASAVLEQLEKLRREQGGARISKVALRVGELAGVDVDCLRFAFECLVKETEWESLMLEIEWLPRRQRCPACDLEFPCGGDTAVERMAAPFTACPRCGEMITELVAGEELEIDYIEVESSEVEQ
jgi:hydrogenase nickel incorporation protein HypA/HybF